MKNELRHAVDAIRGCCQHVDALVWTRFAVFRGVIATRTENLEFFGEVVFNEVPVDVTRRIRFGLTVCMPTAANVINNQECALSLTAAGTTLSVVGEHSVSTAILESECRRSGHKGAGITHRDWTFADTAADYAQAGKTILFSGEHRFGSFIGSGNTSVYSIASKNHRGA